MRTVAPFAAVVSGDLGGQPVEGGTFRVPGDPDDCWSIGPPFSSYSMGLLHRCQPRLHAHLTEWLQPCSSFSQTRQLRDVNELVQERRAGPRQPVLVWRCRRLPVSTRSTWGLHGCHISSFFEVMVLGIGAECPSPPCPLHSSPKNSNAHIT